MISVQYTGGEGGEGGCSTLEDIMSTVENIMRTLGDTMINVGRVHSSNADVLYYDQALKLVCHILNENLKSNLEFVSFSK